MAHHQQPTRDSVTTINDDGSRNFIYPSDTHGRFTIARSALAYLLLAAFFILPWVTINGHPSVLFDVVNRQFFLFGLGFTPQDLWLAFFLMTGVGFTLIMVTALLGRMWCGWTCPHTLALDHVFRRIERLIDGPALERKKLAAESPSTELVLRRLLKHGFYVLAAAAFTYGFFAYFFGPLELVAALNDPITNWGTSAAFLFLGGILYFDFSWFREQFCIILCPYGRIQSTLIDDHSLIIGYDEKRGEPRGKSTDPDAGDCVDCFRCVQVCPTGIDIRQGLQMECIGCANCVDACDETMTKLHRPTGLVRYTSLAALNGGKSRILRPRIILYGILFLIGVVATTYAFSTYQTASISLSRPPGPPYFVEDGEVRNQFFLRLTNKENVARKFTITVLGDGVKNALPQQEVVLEPWQEESLLLVLLAHEKDFRGPVKVLVSVHSDDGKTHLSREVVFLGPVGMVE